VTGEGSEDEQSESSNAAASSASSSSSSDSSEEEENVAFYKLKLEEYNNCALQDGDAEQGEEAPAVKTRRKDSTEKAAARPTRTLRIKTPPAVAKRRESTASATNSEGKRGARKRSPSKRQEEAPTSPKRRVSQDVSKEVAKEAIKEAAIEGQPETPAKKTNPGSANISPLPSSSPQTGSPSGVNRRTAVLFTRKAAAAFRVQI